MNLEYAPDFSLIAEGKDITAAIRTGLVEIKLTDYGGATGQTDTLTITLISPTLTLPQKGARLSLGLGFNGDLVDKGRFVVCGCESSGPPRKIVINATAAPMDRRVQSGDTSSHKNRSFDSTTLGDIVGKIAGDNGLTPRISSSLSGIAVPHVDQVRESDGAFMLRLASRYDAVSKPSGGYWLFLEQGAAETAGGKAVPGFTFTPKMVGRWSYSEGDRGGAKPGGGNTSGKIGAAFYDKATGETRLHEIDHDGSDAHHPYTQPDEDAAITATKSKSTQMKKNERKMTLSGPVRPQLITITAEGRIRTQGFGVREDFSWQVESVSFSLSGSGFSFDISLKTDVSGKASKSGKGGVDFGF